MSSTFTAETPATMHVTSLNDVLPLIRHVCVYLYI